MLIYIIIYLLLLFAILWERESINVETKRKVIFFYIVVFTLFRGLRWDTGTDWEQYYMVFGDVSWDTIFFYDRGYGYMEPGYVLLNLIIRTLGGNYTTFLLLTNFFVLYTYAKFSFSNSNTPIYVFVLMMFSTQFFPVRIGVAVAFIILGLCYFSQKRYLRVVIYTIISASIHSSAIVFLPVYFISFYKRIPWVTAVLICVLALIIVHTDTINTIFSQISFIYGFVGEQNADKFQHYLDYEEKEAVSGIASYFSSLIFILTLFLFGRMLKKTEYGDSAINYDFVYNIYFIFVLIGIAFSSENMSNLKRMQNYFMFAFPILFSFFIYSGRKKYPNFKLIFTLIFIFYIIFRAYILLFTGFPDEHFPYFSIFDSRTHR